MVLTVPKTVQVPQLQFIDKFVDIPVVVLQRQAPMVPTLQKPVEIPEVLFLDKVAEMLVYCTTRGAHGPDFGERPVEFPPVCSCSSSTNSSTSLSCRRG